MFTLGQDVEAKTGGSLGRWVPGTVTRVDREESARFSGRSIYDVLTNSGQVLCDLGEREVRRPRRKVSLAGGPSSAPPRRRPVRVVGRGPLRFPEFRKWVKGKPCLFCHRPADDPHHYGPKGTGQTTDDTRIVPVCRECHDLLHGAQVHWAKLPGVGHLSVEAIKAHIFQTQVGLITEFLRFHDGVMS